MNMHLHGHLRQCIEDYGAVYSFWCFSFERLNGILGSYPTNSHHISVQLMRRFLESKLFAHEHWPVEYVEEYLPLLKQFHYNKGSLIQTTLEYRRIENNEICPLPPIKECAFLQNELDELQAYINAGKETLHEVCVLHHRYSAVMLQTKNLFSHVIGVENSRHSRSSLLLCQKNDSEDIGLAKVQFFAKCNARTDCGEKFTFVVAAVSWYMSHPCFVWYGKPTQVWASTLCPGYNFIPVTNIKSRVVYTKRNVNFGRMIGLDSVYVIVPLDL